MRYNGWLWLLTAALSMTHPIAAESVWDQTPNQVRDRMNRKFLSIDAPTPQVWKVSSVTIKAEGRKTPLRIYRPGPEQNLPVILYIHGGAWVAGNLDTHDNLARYLCRGAQAVVISVGYLNAPEGKFPESLEQCYDALLWTMQHAGDFGGNPATLAVVGDSAGGNMAAVLCLLARDRKGPKIDFQALINPVIDNTWGGTLKPQNDEFDTERWYSTQYVKDPEQTQLPYVSPNFARDLTHLPPALVLLAEKDMFRKGAQEYVDLLRKAGVPANVYIQWGVGHLAGNGARASKMSQESLDVAVAGLRGAFLRERRSD